MARRLQVRGGVFIWFIILIGLTVSPEFTVFCWILQDASFFSCINVTPFPGTEKKQERRWTERRRRAKAARKAELKRFLFKIFKLDFTVLVTPGAVPLHLTPGVSDPDQLNCPTSVIHLKSGLNQPLFFLFQSLFSDGTRSLRNSKVNFTHLY